MATYKNLMALIEVAMDSLPRVEMLVPENEIPAWIEAIPFAHLLEADNACRQYAASLEWPIMETEILFQVDLRLEAAHDLCVAMGDKPLSRALEGSALIEMALISFWHDEAISWAHSIFSPKKT